MQKHARKGNPIAGKSYDTVDSDSADVVAVIERNLCCTSLRTVLAGGCKHAASSRIDQAGSMWRKKSRVI